MKFFKKKYKGTSKIARAFQKANAMQILMESYVMQDNHKRAVQCSRDHVVLIDKAWELIYELYPKLSGNKNITWKSNTKEIIIKE